MLFSSDYRMLNYQNPESGTLSVSKTHLDLRHVWRRGVYSPVTIPPQCTQCPQSHEGGGYIRPRHQHEARRHVRQRYQGENHVGISQAGYK